MRFKSNKKRGFQIFAVAGTNTISFAIDFDDSAIAGLMGFAIEREDLHENERYFMYGFKVFESIVPDPDPRHSVLTFAHPVQSFVWDDFTAKDDREYVYHFYPLRGKPKNLDRSEGPISIRVQTEKAYTKGTHDIFFNRGVAGSQAYARKFGNKRPDDLPEPERSEAKQWLSRDVDDAFKKFIGEAKPGDTLLGAFYEFRYLPVLVWLKEAIDRGVTVKLVIDAKKNGGVNAKGEVVEDFPRDENMEAAKTAGLPKSSVACWREKNTNEIAHNKFLVLLKGAGQQPAAVLTGSMNLSNGGVHGQTNVVHWVREKAVAAQYRDYWNLLSTDPGKPGTGTRAQEKAAMDAFRNQVETQFPVPAAWQHIPQGTSAAFSPRPTKDLLSLYVSLLDEAKEVGCITLAFGVSDVFKDKLTKHSKSSPLKFLLLEKKDKPRKPKPGTQPKPFVALNWRQNVYSAWGSYISDPIYRWVRETNAKFLQLNTHVSYVHSKFLLQDPLGDDPIVVTGSANFSDASTTGNDENMLLIRGDARVADIYFTEFNRLFLHYYFRSVLEDIRTRPSAGLTPTAANQKASLFLDETSQWTKKYAPGSLKRKRVEMFAGMKGCVIL